MIFFIVWVVDERAHNIIARSKNFNDKVISTFAKFLLKPALFFIAQVVEAQAFNASQDASYETCLFFILGK